MQTKCWGGLIWQLSGLRYERNSRLAASAVAYAEFLVRRCPPRRQEEYRVSMSGRDFVEALTLKMVFGEPTKYGASAVFGRSGALTSVFPHLRP